MTVEISVTDGDAVGGLFGDARGRLLRALCGRPQTAAELARRVKTSSNAVRVHLDGLRRVGLVDYQVERRGVGKPRHVYAITSAAENLLSVGYIPTLDALLDELRNHLKSGFTPFMRQVGQALAERSGSRGHRGIPAAVSALESLGASVSVKRNPDGGMMTTQCCPLAAITRNKSEVCNLVASFLASASGQRVQDECVRGEHPRCHFKITGATANVSS